MTRQADRYYLQCEGPGVEFTDRELTADDLELFTTWNRAYGRALQKIEPAPDLLALGREIAQWLDRDYNWLLRLKDERIDSPFIVEFQVAQRDPDEEELRFLEVPWELVADQRGHLAADSRVMFCPVRRIGKISAPPPCSPYRLSLVFMAAEPDTNQRETAQPLAYEEEERAIFQATGNLGLDLIVEESGTLRLLAETVSREKNPHVLHVSCHGTMASEPVLLLETDVGETDPVNPDAFARAFGSNRPGLLFASACKTGETNQDVASSFASDLVQRGWPAVLGWSGSVRDQEATRFAAGLYRHLSLKDSLEAATAQARLELLAPQDQPAGSQPAPARDWHLARLYLGGRGGGPLCGGDQSARTSRIDGGIREFLDAKKQVPVAGRWEFVGRRREIQKILKAVNSPERQHSGVLIHGIGGQGKSSLAARVANRLETLRGHRAAVVYKRYGAASILGAVQEAMNVAPVKSIVERYLPQVRSNPADLETALYEILTGPCREKKTENGIQLAPVLLIIDDFESALQLDTPFPHPIHPDYQAAIRALLRAFKHATPTNSCLIFTSRHTFILKDHDRDLSNDLLCLHLPPMKAGEGRKQAETKALERSVPLPELDRKRTDRVIRAAQGNPGLQDLLFNMLLQAHRERNHAALDQALAEMEQFIDNKKEPRQQQLLEFLENIAIKRLLGLLRDGEKQLLRASTLFQLPVPEKILETLATECGYHGGDPFAGRLYGLGLWEQYRDICDRDRKAVAINALIRSYVDEFDEKDVPTMAAMVIEPLFQAWGGPEDSSSRPLAADWELARLALAAEAAEIIAHTGGDAIRFLADNFLNKQAGEFAKACLDLLAARDIEPRVNFHRQAGDLFAQLGEPELAATCLGRALEKVGDIDPRSTDGENFTYASLLLSQASLMRHKGDIDNATDMLRDAETRFDALGAERERAIVLGDIARIKVSKGLVDDALKLHQLSNNPPNKHHKRP